MKEKLINVTDEVRKVIKGKDDVIDKVLASILAGGHILLEDIPGVGKTTLAVAFSKVMDLEYRRVQFTPDVLPSDIVGFSMYNNKTGDFEYKQGSILCNLFLADEINRTSPKTQSSLLEVMEEKKVTVDGVTRKLPDPFIVIATENPLGSSGTQKLPESQLDRFMVCLSIGYPEHTYAINILKDNAANLLEHVPQVISGDEVVQLQKEVEDMFVHDSMYEYIVTLTEKTRESVNLILGVSPRGSIALLKMSKAMALIRGRNFVIPEDVHIVFKDVFGHRVKLSPRGKANGISIEMALEEIFTSVIPPRT